MSADERIVEALAEHWYCDVTDGIAACMCGHGLGDANRYFTPEHREHVAAVIEPMIREREVKGLRLLRRLAVKNYPKGLMKTATVIADIEDFIERTERNEDS